MKTRYTRELDQICDRFEAQWRTGAAPSIGHYLETGGLDHDHRRVLLRELIALDLEFRGKTSSSAAWSLEEYVRRYPEIGPLDRIPVELIVEEYRTRRRHHIDIDICAFIARFPGRGSQLEQALAAAADETLPHEPEPSGQPRPATDQVRCPECGAVLEGANSANQTKVSCPSCGVAIRLVNDGADGFSLAAPARLMMERFQLLEKVGEGAFGIVWRSFDPKLDRIVAVKVPRRGELDPGDANRFFDEARIAAKLNHPGIVNVYEAGIDQGTVYIVSEFVDGVTLDEWLKNNKLSVRETAGLCASIADGLHHAHETGVVHRDLKPGNLMISPRGGRQDLGGGGEDLRLPTPRIMDFGLACREPTDITMTLDGNVLGTPAYMSPEQASGHAHRADRRSDIYSLGVILFEMLTGERPFRGGVRTLLDRTANDEPPSPRKLNALVPRDLDTICLKCLEKSPARRYPNADELAQELRRFLDRQPINARPLTWAGRMIRRARRQPIVAALSLALLLLVLAGLAGVMWQWRAAVEANHRLVAVQEERDQALIAVLFSADPNAVPQVLRQLAYSKEEMKPRIQANLKSAQSPRRLRSAYALIYLGEHDPSLIEMIMAEIPRSDPDESGNILASLATIGTRAVGIVSKRAERETDPAIRLRLAILASGLGDFEAVRALAAFRANPAFRAAILQGFRERSADLNVLTERIDASEDPAFRSVALLAIGMSKDASIGLREALAPRVIEFYRSAPDSATHSAAAWLLRRWGIEPPALAPSPRAVGSRQWFVNGAGMTMIRLPGRSLHMCDQEVWGRLFQKFLDDPDGPTREKPAELAKIEDLDDPELLRGLPVWQVNWFDAILFCNWLSRREGRAPCYHRTGAKRSWTDWRNITRQEDEWDCDFQADGYRLPTDAEWELACRSGTTTAWHFGDDAGTDGAWLFQYGQTYPLSNRKRGPCRSKLPNDWGLFDMYGNVAEWCWDQRDLTPEPGSVKTASETGMEGRVIRGGGANQKQDGCQSASVKSQSPINRFTYVGFRVVCGEPSKR